MLNIACIHFESSGSVTCDAEVVLVSGSNEKIVQVLNEINTTGVFGNLSIVPNSLITSNISGNGSNLGYW